jgi:hypothetical protein
MCEQEREDTQHLWRCPATMEMQRERWTEEIEGANAVGTRVWKSVRKAWEKEIKKAQEKGQDISQRKPPTFRKASEDDIWEALQLMVKGVRDIRRTEVDPEVVGEDIERLEWSVQDLYHGLTPKCMTRSWKRIFHTTERIAAHMVSSFVQNIEEFGRTEIWNKRCKVTVDWEREHGITAVSKRARGRNCVGEHRRSNSNFMGSTLRQRSALDAKEISDRADDRVRRHYEGRLRLDVMERLGGCSFLKLAEDRG